MIYTVKLESRGLKFGEDAIFKRVFVQDHPKYWFSWSSLEIVQSFAQSNTLLHGMHRKTAELNHEYIHIKSDDLE